MTDQSQLDQKAINTIRFLAVDAVQKANSGHPGTPMGAATIAYTLWDRFLKHNPRNPEWPNRDRFILSPGHASMLLYSLLYLTGYDISLDDLKRFRQWGSKTLGHPEYRETAGVEMTTGPLGQGFAHGVGMAMAELWLAARYNREGFDLFDHYTYAIVSDGDMHVISRPIMVHRVAAKGGQSPHGQRRPPIGQSPPDKVPSSHFETHREVEEAHNP